MTPEADVTTFSAMFAEMAWQWAHTRRRRRSAADSPVPSLTVSAPAADDEASIRAAMETALERRRQKRTRDARKISGRGYSDAIAVHDRHTAAAEH
jgi:hypothetical protein